MVNLNKIIAVVDDDELVCRAIKRLLLSVGIVAETYSSGEEFLGTIASIPSYRPACVILDIQMPGLGGLEVQRQLASSGVPIILITAHDDLAVREEAFASGAAGYLQKPFNAPILIAAVEKALAGTTSQ